MMNDSDIPDGPLDRSDQRIVGALQINPRAGVAEMGRILGEHERSAARRVQRLLATRVVRTTAQYDPVRCGLGHTVQLRLTPRRGCLEDVAAGLAKRPDVPHVAAVTAGAGRLWCELLVPSRPLLHSLMADGVPGLPDADVLDAHITLRHFKTEAQWHAPVLTEEEKSRLRASMVQPLPGLADHYELTPTDRRVAETLIDNARVSLTDLAGELGFSTATAGRRVASLLERRVLHLRTVVDPALMGRPVEARVRLKVHPAGIETVGETLAACPDVLRCTAVTGSHNLLADVCLEHESRLYGFVVDRLGSLPHILDLDTDVVTHTYKRGPSAPGDDTLH
ncbi:Lrp/AsnC family transcriptional regulator [Streptomyces sp. NBC_01275]|uniref:Lrp/AsnC family transcriptional regulator n=1 Tax=Streptomyces sp. NBC_01275 TaxID=2903807 RepID=UPI002250DD08|nr:Lrp/AsnC family transcriptional regulator [Streptomyces sp. NBC_01275]MCX4762375.1 Lrp/AsnC family transcriptional regulator [Streptomyces sp. NBC_01275]